MTDPNKTIDYDIHGLVGIRLINPTEGDAAAVDRQLGPTRKPLSRKPDILIRFEKQVDLPDFRYLGLHAGFNDSGYYILRSRKAEAKVRIPFEEIGSKCCEIVCESGLRAVPMLIAILNFTLLKKNCVPLHASAFAYNGTGVLVTGWSKGGKTEAMLSFTHNGAEYVGDEWVILTGDGQKMYGLPEPVTVWDWHMEYLPHIRKKVSRNKSRIFQGVWLLNKMQSIAQKSFLKDSFVGKSLKEALPAFQRQMHVNLPPEKLFGGQTCRLSVKLDKVFFIMSHKSPEITVENGDPADIIERMISSIEYEQLPIKEHYLAYKFAFPDRKNSFLEQGPKIQYELLRSALTGKEAYRVRHPYPVSFPELFKKMSPYCEKLSEERGQKKKTKSHQPELIDIPGIECLNENS
ncbi:hypothetical protein GWN42_05255 [candidate division KSB1 bacterium]|nr:hypothetical protein [candidate division KSB1 bacterium]